MTEVPERRRGRALRWLPWAVVGVVMVGLASVAVVRLFVTDGDEPGETDSVQAVADLAASAAEDLDVGAGSELLCEPPLELYRMAVDSTITAWQTRSGTQTPDITARIDDVDPGATGSFVIRISSDEPGLEEERRTFRVFVETRDGRSCVVGIGGVKAESPTTRFAGGGYSPVTSPPPAPTR